MAVGFYASNAEGYGDGIGDDCYGSSSSSCCMEMNIVGGAGCASNVMVFMVVVVAMVVIAMVVLGWS